MDSWVVLGTSKLEDVLSGVDGLPLGVETGDASSGTPLEAIHEMLTMIRTRFAARDGQR